MQSAVIYAQNRFRACNYSNRHISFLSREKTLIKARLYSGFIGTVFPLGGGVRGGMIWLACRIHFENSYISALAYYVNDAHRKDD